MDCQNLGRRALDVSSKTGDVVADCDPHLPGSKSLFGCLPQALCSSMNKLNNSETTTNMENYVFKNKETVRYRCKGTQCIKSRRIGRSSYGDRCICAHGFADAKRVPNEGSPVTDGGTPGNEMSLCRRFASGLECPYRGRCIFLHQRLGNWNGNRELLNRNGNGDLSKGCSATTILASGDRPPSSNTNILRTKLCKKWATTNWCRYGANCIFAHGKAELRRMQSLSGSKFGVESSAPPQANPKDAPLGDKKARGTASAQQAPEKKCCFKRGKDKKIAGIYADWIDEEGVVAN